MSVIEAEDADKNEEVQMSNSVNVTEKGVIYVTVSLQLKECIRTMHSVHCIHISHCFKWQRTVKGLWTLMKCTFISSTHSFDGITKDCKYMYGTLCDDAPKWITQIPTTLLQSDILTNKELSNCIIKRMKFTFSCHNHRVTVHLQ